MPRLVKKEDIKVWRTNGLGLIDFRIGNAVAEPYPKHWHDEYQFCLITDGGGELVYRGSRQDTPAASLFVVHPGEIHSNDTKTGCSFRSAYIDPALIADATESPREDQPFFGNGIIFDRAIVETFFAVHALSERGVKGLEFESSVVTFIQILASRTHSAGANRKAGIESLTVKRAQEYIAANYEQNISLRDLAELTDLSPYHLSRVFSNAVGVPPHAFQTQVRISAAKRSLRNGLSVADAAAHSGFADQSHFHRHFRRLMKVTPGEYLKNSKNVQ